MINPVYSVLIEHNFDKVRQSEFIIKNIQNFLKLSKLYINFNILVSSEDKQTIENNIYILKQQIKKKCNIDINIILTEEEKNSIIDININKNYKIINFSSDMLLSYFFYQNLNSFFYNFDRNISFPVMHYKYIYSDFSYKNKIFNIKKFLLSDLRYYQESDEIPDWDERLYIDSKIFNKMNGKIPIVCPSPLLHNWGYYLPLILSSKKQETIKICNSNFSIHKFEKI